ncbi:MAG: hypothetical protein Q7O66_22995, partial [Dehalococcoidia bacterium]|nr:hypothetical protein [Dehalococcoidia bacterium]
MYRQFVVWIASVLLLVVAIDPTAPSLILATGPIPTQSNYVLNSEGDEWIKVDPGLVKPITPTPVVMQVGNGEEREPRLAPPVLESPESMLGIALDRARNAGPEAVLAFVASQADPHFPLLDEAVRESESLMPGVAPEAPAPDAVNHASLNSGPCAYTSIQLAVNAAANGNTVRVASGTFTETVDISGRAITIEGDYDSTCNTLTSAPTQLNGNAAGSVVDVSAGSVVALRNLNLTGGSAFGAGLELLGSSTVTLSNTNIFSNTGLSGGGIYVGAGSVVTFSDDSDIYNNTASGDGGGAMVFGQLFGYDTDSDVYQNSAANGGGIAVPGGTVRLTNSNVVANTATNNGGGFSVTNGGVFYLANGSRTWLDDFLNIMPRFMVNTAANGGAIYAANSPRVDCDGAEFGSSNDGNKATTGSGGAIYLGGSALFADNCIFRNNEAQAGNGGAIAAYTSTLSIDTDYPASVAAPNLSPDRRQSIEPLATLCNPSTVQCSSLYGNRAISSTLSNGYGGAIYVNASTLSLADTFLHRNTAVR